MKPVRSLGVGGQTALEYIMTYGWAILIMAFAAVVLYQMGIFDLPTPPGCTGFSQVGIMDWKAVSTEGALHLSISNDAGTRIRLVSVNASIFNNECAEEAINYDMRAGEIYSVNLTDCVLPGVGDYYKAYITVTYRNIASDLEHNSVGECHGPVE